MKSLLTIFFALFLTSIFAQVNSTNNLSLVKEISIKKFIGKRFRVSVDIKNVPADSIGFAELYILQVGKSDYDFVEKTARRKPANKVDTNWHTYNVTGTVNNLARKIWIYASIGGNGDFYYDNFSLEIEDIPNVWNKIAIPNGNFEESNDPLKDFRNTESLKNKPGIKLSLDVKSDNHYLHINATGAIKTYAYGKNSSIGKYFSSGNTKIYYEVYGKGSPLLLLHGNGGSISSFKDQIPAFAEHYRVIVVDTRGQGKSIDTTSERFSYDQFAEDMKVLLDSLNLKQVNVLGWSDGGNIALILAMRYPEYVKKLITMGANLNPDEAAIGAKMIKQVHDDVRKLKAQNDHNNKTNILLMEMMLNEPHITPDDLQKITAKTLILAGEKDIILENHTKLIAQSVPKAEIIILKGESHFVSQENPTLFNKRVLDFLAKP